LARTESQRRTSKPGMMSDNTTRRPPEVAERLVEIFGADKLALVLRCYELIQAEGGYGGIEIVICAEAVQNVKATVSVK
jgi:hypothetical protein